MFSIGNSFILRKNAGVSSRFFRGNLERMISQNFQIVETSWSMLYLLRFALSFVDCLAISFRSLISFEADRLQRYLDEQNTVTIVKSLSHTLNRDEEKAGRELRSGECGGRNFSVGPRNCVSRSVTSLDFPRVVRQHGHSPVGL